MRNESIREDTHATRGLREADPKPLEIGVDARALAGRTWRGVAVYLKGMLSALASGYPGDTLHLLLPGDGDGGLPPSLLRENVVAHRKRLPGRLIYGSAAVAGRPRLDRLIDAHVDVMWIPAPSPAAVSRELPYVLTLHDLSFDLRPTDFTRYEQLWHRLARPQQQAERAAGVLAVSGAIRQAALERWGLDPARVAVASPGVEWPQTPAEADVAEARRRHGLEERYLLFVGALEPRKAPDVLARAYALARADGLDAELAIAGAGRLEGELTGEGVRLLGSVGHGDLVLLLAGALAVVMPSRSEGFGFPPLEAAALGTPAVVSDLPVFAETLGDAALRVPYGDAPGLASALGRIAGDAELRARLAAAAAERARRYTWESAARSARACLAEAARR